MPKAAEVATELRKLADRLEAAGELNVPYAFVIFTFQPDSKDSFLTFAKEVMPRPFKKVYNETAYASDLRLVHDAKNEDNVDTLTLWAKIDRKSLCRLVKPAQPAVYDCDPLFSEAEEEEIGV